MTIEVTLKQSKYLIVQDSSCYTVNRVVTVQDEASKNFGKESLKVLSYPTRLSKALETIINDEMASSNETVTLEEYINRYDASIAELKEQVEFKF